MVQSEWAGTLPAPESARMWAVWAASKLRIGQFPKGISTLATRKRSFAAFTRDNFSPKSRFSRDKRERCHV